MYKRLSCHVAIVVSILKNTFQKLFHFTKLFINILQASLLVLSRHYEATAEVICSVWIATPHFTKGGQTPVRLAMTKKILSLRGFVKTEVIHKKEILLFWIASLPFAMTDIKNKIAHAVRHMAMTITKIFNSISFRDYSLLFIKKIY